VPENIKALIVVLVLAMPIFWIARSQVCEASISLEDFDRRRNLWLAITIFSFLIPNFWAFAAISGMLILRVARKDSNSIALFLFVVFAFPQLEVTIPGIGGIQQIFSVSYTRILAVLVLAPAFFKISSQSDTESFGKTLTDKFLLAYIIWPLILQINVDSLTNTIRFAFYSITDVFLPYYVASRGLKSFLAWRDAFMSFTISVALLAIVAVFEYIRKWPLYGSVPHQMGIDWDFASFMLRADSLRATATAGHAIVLGYVLMVGLAFYASTKNDIKSTRWRVLLGIAIVLGLFATAARGPWVGTVAVVLVLIVTGRKISSRLVQLVAGVGVTVGLLMTTNWGTEFLAYLPFVGSAESESVAYRQRLFDVSVQVIGLHPAFGSFDYMRNPLMQQMMQGQGIIDLVNSYLGIALTYGLIGLGLFLGVFVCSGIKVWKIIRATSKDTRINTMGRCLLASLVGILITIGTASSVSFIALVYWIVAGLCVGYVRFSSSEIGRIGEAVNQDSSEKRMRYTYGNA
jgi:O-antigen ligase